MEEVTREMIIDAARRISSASTEPISRDDFLRKANVSEWQLNRLFPKGRWTEVRTLAGIDRHPLDKPSITNDELIEEYHRIATEEGKLPTWAVFNSKAKSGSDTLMRRRFGGLDGAVRAYFSWLKEKHPDSPLLEQLDLKSKHELSPAIKQIPSKGRFVAALKGGGPVFGAPLDFRGLRHAPTNEQGVVYIFGMISNELGFIVEALQPDFPDCEAKRMVAKDRWQRVRIEFEYRSSNFVEHGHPIEGADMIVCWENNWPECPIEVLELRSAIDQLEG